METVNPSTAPITDSELYRLLAKAAKGGPLTDGDLLRLLALEDPDQLAALMRTAREVRQRHFGDGVFLYGFLYVSTYCRNHCRFCLYRKDNPEAPRYRKTRAEILHLAKALAASGVHLIDLTMGEDPEIYDDSGRGFPELIDTVAQVGAATGLPVMASVGVVPEPMLQRFAETGVAWYACYQETHTLELYRQLRSGQDFGERLESKVQAKRRGLLVEEGILTGVGEGPTDLVRSLRAMQSLGADQVRAMTFVPQVGTPMAAGQHPSALLELKIIALMRILMPDVLIPASLDIDGLSGLQQRLDAGANVVTSLVPPGEGLAGVAQSELDIEAGKRSVAGIQEILTACGLKAAGADQYRSWMAERQKMMSAPCLENRCAS